MANRPYTQPRPKQHDSHVWAWVAFRREQKRELERFTTFDKPDPLIKRSSNKPLTSGGRGLGRFGRW